MDPNDVLKKAWVAVEASGVPESLYETAFQTAVRLLTGPNPQAAASPVDVVTPAPLDAPDGAPEGQDAGADPTERPAGTDFFSKVSRVCGLSREAVAKVFYLEEDVVQLYPSASELGKTNADRARSVAVLLVAVYDWAFETRPLPISVVKSACQALHCYDSKNFSSNVNDLQSIIITGEKQRKLLRAKPATVAAFREIMQPLVGEAAS
ncbi:hypothetical protein [Curtobacterium sp. BH-2-1-1]|uniref:hypothetical protein n=1 Tax=Curtobacterium sp. BH-2-1-1 TaxID=1905847 RepID=UPI0011AA262D|nr:hypothetical protein [Curtobacterium sp. BH-2-1-1]